MSLEDFNNTNRALVFGVFKPGEESLADRLESWDGVSGPDFIQKQFAACKYDHRALENMEVVFYFKYKEYPDGRQKGCYSLEKDAHGVKIRLNEHHPLHELIKSYRKLADEAGALMVEAKGLSLIDGASLRSKGRELFQKTLRAFEKKDNELFQKRREDLLNFFHDPLCLSGALLDVLEALHGRAAAQNHPRRSGSLPESPLIDIPIPSRIRDQILEKKHLPTLPQVEGSPAPAALPGATGGALALVSRPEERNLTVPELWKRIQNDGRWEEDKYLPTIYREAFKEHLKPGNAETLDLRRFLLFCLSDDHLSEWFDQLSLILIDGWSAQQEAEASRRIDGEEPDIWRARFNGLLKVELSTVGGLLANIEGLKVISRTCAHARPEIFLPNCSLSDIYKNKEIRVKFEHILKNLNPDPSKDSHGNHGHRIGLCIIPRVIFSIGDTESALDNDNIFGDDEPTAVKAEDLGDGAEFGHFCEFLEFCDKEKLRIMTLVSSGLDLPVHRIEEKIFDKDEKQTPAYLLSKLEARLGEDKSPLKHLTVCLPDKIFINELEFSFGVKTPMILLKGAFLVAAVVMRNDSPEELRRLLGQDSQYVREQPGVAIGPQVEWKGRKLFDSHKPLFTLPYVVSDISTDVHILERLLDPNVAHACYSFLRHERDQKVALQLFNTPYRGGNSEGMGSPFVHGANIIRAFDLLYLRKSTMPPKRFEGAMKNPDGWNRNRYEIFYINALQPERVVMRLPEASDDRAGSIIVE